MNLSDSELKAMMSLLDDPDEAVQKAVLKKLLEIPASEVGRLERVVDELEDLPTKAKVLDLIHRIQFQVVYHGLKEWAEAGANDLLEGIIWVARYRYPHLTRDEMLIEIENIRTDVWMLLDESAAALDQVRAINHVFYEKYGYRGDDQNYHLPENSYLNEVIRQRKGNPISLATLYLLVAQRLGLPIFGVNLPKHFVLVFVEDAGNYKNLAPQQRPVLFYINAFNKGAIFTKQDVEQFLMLLKLPVKAEFFLPCTNEEIIIRYINNLISYFNDHDQSRLNELMLLRGLFPED
jgi:regulator of sirC expression with transglutaminase-like and TPR domain